MGTKSKCPPLDTITYLNAHEVVPKLDMVSMTLTEIGRLLCHLSDIHGALQGSPNRGAHFKIRGGRLYFAVRKVDKPTQGSLRKIATIRCIRLAEQIYQTRRDISHRCLEALVKYERKVEKTRAALDLAFERLELKKLKERPKATAEQIERARLMYAYPSDDDIEIDEDALVSNADTGVWVQAWVWLPDDEDSL